MNSVKLIKISAKSDGTCKYKKYSNFFIQAFRELQEKMISAQQQVKIAESQIVHLKRSIQHASLTDQEISQLPESTKTYESIGRM